MQRAVSPCLLIGGDLLPVELLTLEGRFQPDVILLNFLQQRQTFVSVLSDFVSFESDKFLLSLSRNSKTVSTRVMDVGLAVTCQARLGCLDCFFSLEEKVALRNLGKCCFGRRFLVQLAVSFACAGDMHRMMSLECSLICCPDTPDPVI